MEAEISALTHGFSAAILWDLKECYEHINRKKLLSRAKALGFPLQLLRAALNAYVALRLVTLGDGVEVAGFPFGGVVAGCGFALVAVQIYAGDALREFIDRWPLVVLQVFVDDYFLQASGNSKEVVVEKLKALAQELVDIIEVEFGCVVSVPKVDAVTSDPQLTVLLDKLLGPLSGKPSASVANFCIDYAGGKKRRGFWKQTIRGTRFKTLKLRSKRLARLNKATKGRASGKIFLHWIVCSSLLWPGSPWSR